MVLSAFKNRLYELDRSILLKGTCASVVCLSELKKVKESKLFS